MSMMTASVNYDPGDLILEERPFVHVLRRSLSDIACEGCVENSEDLKYCKQCLVVKYCGRECQKTDWKDHKFECKHLKNLPETNEQDFVRLLGNVILKIKSKKWKSIQKNVRGTVTTFHDLDSHIQHIQNDAIMKLFCTEMKELTRRFIGIENMPNDEDFTEILGKVKYNAFRDTSRTSISFVGYCLFIGAPKFEQECIPNCNVDLREKTVKVWAIKKIKKGSKITVNYRHILTSKTLLMDDEFLENCECKECSLPYGESILNRIIDKNRAYSVITETERMLKFSKTLSLVGVDLEILENVVDELLEKQKDVLGPTHALHLKTLALKCFHIECSPVQMKATLKELELLLRMVYGDYYLEMEKLYKMLVEINLMFGNPLQALYYMDKISSESSEKSEKLCGPRVCFIKQCAYKDGATDDPEQSKDNEKMMKCVP